MRIDANKTDESRKKRNVALKEKKLSKFLFCAFMGILVAAETIIVII